MDNTQDSETYNAFIEKLRDGYSKIYIFSRNRLQRCIELNSELGPDILKAAMDKNVQIVQTNLRESNNTALNQSLPMQLTINHAFYYSSLRVGDETKVLDKFSFVFDKTIIQYEHHIGKEQSSLYNGVKHNYTYLKTYAVVGLAKESYAWFLQKVAASNAESVKLIDVSQPGTDGYVWVTVDMPQSQVVNCSVYLNESKRIVSVGTLYDIMALLERNLSGLAIFNVDLMRMKSPENVLFLKFILKEFQITDTTHIARPSTSSFSHADISPRLRKILQNKGLINSN